MKVRDRSIIRCLFQVTRLEYWSDVGFLPGVRKGASVKRSDKRRHCGVNRALQHLAGDVVRAAGSFI